MGMIDEAYPSEGCQNGQSSTLVNNLKSQSMISSPVQGQNIQASSQNGGNNTYAHYPLDIYYMPYSIPHY